MAIDIHSQIILSDELHVPKGFTEASTDQVPSKNSSGELEWVSTDGFSGPQGPTGPSGSLAIFDVADASNPVELSTISDVDFGTELIVRQVIAGEIDIQTFYVYDVDASTIPTDGLYAVTTSMGGNTRWIAGTGAYGYAGPISTATGETFISASDKASFRDSLSTGFEGAPPLLSINGDNTKFNMSECTVVHVDNSTIPATVVKTFTPASVDNVPTFLLTETSTFISIDINGAIVQRITKLTPEQRRDEATVGFLSHPDMTTIDSYVNNPQTTRNTASQAHDLMEAIGFFSTSGNQISGITLTLSMQKATGSGFALNANAAITEKDPHNFNMPVLNPAVMFQVLRDATPVAISEFIDPTQWDNNGVLDTVPANNNATINYVYIFPNNQIAYVLGQQIFTTFSDAKDAAGTESVVLPNDISDSALLLARVIVRKTTTDLTNSSEAFILPSTAVSGGGSALTSLQQAYEISVEPEIEINSSHGAFTVQDAAIPLGVNILEVKSAGGASTLLSVDVDGLELATGARANEISIDGTLAGNSDTAIPTEQAVKTYVDNLPSGSSTFAALTDTPANYTASSLQSVRVNVGETALEFFTPSAGGSGDVVGPVSSLANEIAIYSDLTGKIIKNSNVLIDVDGRISQTALGDSVYLGGGCGLVDDLTTNWNVGIGVDCLKAVTSGSRNVAIGYQAVFTNTSGTSNIGIGYKALFAVNGGGSNIALGPNAGVSITTASDNVLLGSGSGSGLSSGRRNVFIGGNSGNTMTTGDESIIIGYGATIPFVGTQDKQLNIGNVIQGDLATGKIGVGTANPTNKLELKGSLAKTITGLTAISGGTPTMTGSGTFYKSELSIGCAVNIIGEIFTVTAIGSDTNATLDSNHSVGTGFVAITTDEDMLKITSGDDGALFRVDGIGSIYAHAIKKGTSQALAGANVDELWVDTATNAIKIGV